MVGPDPHNVAVLFVESSMLPGCLAAHGDPESSQAKEARGERSRDVSEAASESGPEKTRDHPEKEKRSEDMEAERGGALNSKGSR